MEDVMIENITKKKKKKKIIIITLLLAIVSTGVFLFIKSKNSDMGGASISGYILGNGVEPGLTDEEIQALLNKKVDESKVSFSIYTEPTFNGKKGTIMFANPRYSAHNIDLSVTYKGKEIIKTDKIKPDQYIKDIKLLGKALKKGEHSAIATIKAYDQKTDEIKGQVVVDLNITSK